MSLPQDLVDAARVLAAERLVDAFGHVSARTSENTVVITPPQPLGTLGADTELLEFTLAGEDLPGNVPREAWIHWAIYRRRDDVRGICRAQPPGVAAAVGGGLRIRALHGQGAFVGAEVSQYDDARLIRERARGEALAESLSDGWAIVMRGNGAVTVGADIGAATARMYVLEASARINTAAAAGGTPALLAVDEVEAWQNVAPEILGRLWDHLRTESRHQP